ncbi:MAG: class I SAM-dependent methyltransferase [Bacteroidota bacterium]|nr:class I SAM-dependent methyltransferase [Bacteroidota bacterium]MDP4211276.1 class I SAM-dependent methyltransferase [Bacteroidota bacterium]MDP4250035.1 class I SAM-dependent methyltransferase [Bacteroidota bacterium]
MNCKICQHTSHLLLQGRILNKYNVGYYQCSYCGFIQTEEAYWLKEAYSDAIADTDVGYVTRNISQSSITSSIIKSLFNKGGYFIDYGGGYGLFVRLMRDKGFRFYRQDIYCENIFARHFDLTDLIGDRRFELLTSFEVFEHLDNPMAELERMFTYSDSILFSTELQPEQPLKLFEDWWYFAPHMGQHIALYSLESLKVIAKTFNCHLYSNKRNLHLLTPKKLKFNPVKRFSFTHNLGDKLMSRNFQNKNNLILEDYEFIRSGYDQQINPAAVDSASQ